MLTYPAAMRSGIITLTNLAFKYKKGISKNEHIRVPIKPRIKKGIDNLFGISPELPVNIRK
jgi:hypothetical protein